MKTDISVIIPVYNPGEYFEECLELVVNQDFTGNYEIILIDDGSTDKSPEICRKYAEKYSNITVITQENGGQSKARNEGLKIARGEYISFIDSDDMPSKNNLSALHKTAVALNADVVFGGFYVSEVGMEDYVYAVEENYCGKFLSPEEFFKTVTKMRLLFSCTVWAKLIRRDILVKNNLVFPEGRIYEDIIMCPTICSCAESFAFEREMVYSYRLGVETSTTADKDRSYRQRDINDIFTAALDVSRLSIKNVSRDVERAFKKAITESVLVFYMEYQEKELAKTNPDKLEKGYIFFGASTWAQRCLNALNGMAESVLLCDNDINKHGKEMFGHIVIPPDDLKSDENKDKKIMITSMYFMEIYAQLVKIGAVTDIAQIMPHNGRTDIEKLYISWIKKIEKVIGN